MRVPPGLWTVRWSGRTEAPLSNGRTPKPPEGSHDQSESTWRVSWASSRQSGVSSMIDTMSSVVDISKDPRHHRSMRSASLRHCGPSSHPNAHPPPPPWSPIIPETPCTKPSSSRSSPTPAWPRSSSAATHPSGPRRSTSRRSGRNPPNSSARRRCSGATPT